MTKYQPRLAATSEANKIAAAARAAAHSLKTRLIPRRRDPIAFAAALEVLG